MLSLNNSRCSDINTRCGAHVAAFGTTTSHSKVNKTTNAKEHCEHAKARLQTVVWFCCVLHALTLSSVFRVFRGVPRSLEMFNPSFREGDLSCHKTRARFIQKSVRIRVQSLVARPKGSQTQTRKRDSRTQHCCVLEI